MKRDIPLTREQQELVENNLSLVYWVIMESIHVNETVYGFEYEDLHQEGCIWLCHAAATYDPARSQFPTYAKRIVRNGLLSYCRQYPGKVTYPALPDFTGSAFVRNIIYELCGWEQFQTMEADYETVKEAIAPALDYLRSLNPYLWNEGRTFPDSSTTVDAMFTDGELVLGMSYSPYGVAVGIENGVYTPTTRTFLFENGTIGNTNYMSIAFNAPNPAGALVVINAMISAGLQLSQYEKLRNLPVVSPEKLSVEEKAAFDAVDMGEGVLTQEELLTHRLPEMPAKLVPVIEEIWLNEVVGK